MTLRKAAAGAFAIGLFLAMLAAGAWQADNKFAESIGVYSLLFITLSAFCVILHFANNGRNDH